MDPSLNNSSGKLDKHFVASIRSRQLGKTKCKKVAVGEVLSDFVGSDTSPIQSINVNQRTQTPPTEEIEKLNKDLIGLKCSKKAKNQDDVQLSSFNTSQRRKMKMKISSPETFDSTSQFVPKSEKTENLSFFLEHTSVDSVLKSRMLMNQTVALSIKSTTMKKERDQEDKSSNQQKKGDSQSSSMDYSTDEHQCQYVPNSSMTHIFPEDELLLFDDDSAWKEFIQDY
jgi:hypothetical protein